MKHWQAVRCWPVWNEDFSGFADTVFPGRAFDPADCLSPAKAGVRINQQTGCLRGHDDLFSVSLSRAFKG